jgi:hypothetical protein
VWGVELIPDLRVKVRQEEELEMKQFENQPGKEGKLGLKGKPLTAQEEEATKDDDAKIPYHLWNYRLTILWDSDILPPSIQKPAEVLRETFPLRFWKMKVRRSFFYWFSKEFHFRQAAGSVVSWDGTKYVWGDKQNAHYKHYKHYWRTMWGNKDNARQNIFVFAADCIERAANSSWWNCEDGSRPFFWRWSEEYHNQIRDRIPLWYIGTAPHNFRSQKKENDPELRNSMGAKLMKVFTRIFLLYGMILSLASYFAVRKEDTYVRMVYNGTPSVMNAHLWAPWFALPTICALLRALELDTYMTDSDIGEIFLNFMLEERCARLAGVDLTRYVEKGEDALDGKRHLVRWGRCLMG